ncbi:DUF1275 domain-containing protein [Kitasatospora sp. NBC_00374]|uniref:DUF1275 family protein n=1 Tax=Kitasatospora sp. NBC_00374 TaxID=2975964 RepID=UPI0030DF9486
MPQRPRLLRHARRPGPGAATHGLLVLAAGGANAFGFLALGGVFTSVVTANAAVLGLSLGGADPGAARLVALALLGYGAGAAAGSLAAGGRGRVPALGVRGGLLLETLALWLVSAAWLYWDGAPDPTRRAMLLFLTAVAMGCQNGSVRATGSEATTAYLTGTVTSAIAVLVTQGRLARRSVGSVLLFIAGAAAVGAAFRWLHPAAPLLPALLVTAALRTAGPAARRAAPDAHRR